MKHLKLFASHSQFIEPTDKPAVSYCEQENEVHYHPNKLIIYYNSRIQGAVVPSKSNITSVFTDNVYLTDFRSPVVLQINSQTHSIYFSPIGAFDEDQLQYDFDGYSFSLDGYDQSHSRLTLDEYTQSERTIYYNGYRFIKSTGSLHFYCSDLPRDNIFFEDLYINTIS